MRVGFRKAVPLAVSALLSGACGETQQQQPAPGSAGAGGVLTTGGTEAFAGSNAQTSPAGAGGSSAGTGQGQTHPGQAGQGGSGAPAACVPEVHERPEPGPLTGSFASLSGD